MNFKTQHELTARDLTYFRKHPQRDELVRKIAFADLGRYDCTTHVLVLCDRDESGTITKVGYLGLSTIQARLALQYGGRFYFMNILDPMNCTHG